MSSPKFESYDWENDPNWHKFEGTGSINKLKEDYFRKNIDPNYKPTSTTSSSTTSQRTNTTSSSTNSTSPNSTRRSTTTAAAPKPTFKKFLYGSWVLAQTSVVFLTIAFFITGNPYFFYKAFIAATISYSIPIFNTYEGTTLSKEELARKLLENENAQFVIYSMIFYFLGTASLVYLLPNFIYSFFHVLKLVSPYCSRVPFVQGLLEKLSSFNTKAIDFAISIEINILLIAFFSIFSSLTNILLVFIYFRYIKLRYHCSQRIQTKVNEYSLMIDQLSAHPRCPQIIRNFIPKIKYVLSR